MNRNSMNNLYGIKRKLALVLIISMLITTALPVYANPLDEVSFESIEDSISEEIAITDSDQSLNAPSEETVEEVINEGIVEDVADTEIVSEISEEIVEEISDDVDELSEEDSLENDDLNGASDDCPDGENTESDRAILIQEGEFDIPQFPTAEDYYELICSDSDEVLTGAFDLAKEEYNSLCETLKNAYINGFDNDTDSSVIIEEYNIPYTKDGKEFLKEVVSFVINDNPELFYADASYSYSYNAARGIITKFTPMFIKQYTSEDVDKFNGAVTKAKIRCKEDCDYDNGGNYELDVAIALHDYLVNNCEYDTITACAGKSEDSRVHRAYSALVDGVTVCQGYSLAYMYLCRQMGVDCYYVSSREMNHGWNAVKLGDDLYHVDLTWDDPLYNRVGLVGHDYMFLSDTAMGQERGGSDEVHKGWKIYADIEEANSEYYDNAYWYEESINSPLIRKDGCYYYLSYDGSDKISYLIKRNISTCSENIISSQGYKWYANSENSKYWTKPFSGLFQYGGRLYYNTSNEIRSIEFDGSDEKSEFAPEIDETENIYGISIEDNVLHYAVRDKDSASPHGFADSTPRVTSLCVLSSVDNDPYACATHDIDYSNEITLLNPTCMMEGKKGYLCQNCGMIVELEEIEKTNHASSGVFKQYSEATCMLDEKKYSKCRYGCGTTLLRTIANTKLEHVWDDGFVTKVPTHGEEGEITYTCTLGCGSTMTNPIERLAYEKVLDKKSVYEYNITLSKGGKTDAIEEFASQKGVCWKVTYSPKGYASLSKKGVISGTKEGSTVITLNNGDDVYTINVNVSLPKYEQKILYINVGEGTKNIGLYNTDLEPEYKSSKTSIATVDILGNVTGIKPGKTIISAVICGKKYNTTVQVCDPVISGKTKQYIGKRQNLKIKYGVKNTEWSSQDNSVITVDNKGRAKAVGYGSTVITAKNNDKTVTLNIEVPMFEISGKDHVASGKNLSLKIKNGYGKTQWWVENLTGEAEVKNPEKGVISAMTPGTVRVYAQNCDAVVYKDITIE